MLRKVCPIAAPSYMLLNAPTVSFMFCTIKKKKIGEAHLLMKFKNHFVWASQFINYFENKLHIISFSFFNCLFLFQHFK